MGMFGFHVVDRGFGMEVETLREKGFRGLTILSFFGEIGGSTNIVGLLRGGIWFSCAWLTSGFSPKDVIPPLAELENALFDDGGLLFEILLPGGKEEREFGVSEDFSPCIHVVGRPKSVTPERVFQCRHFALR